MGRAWAPGSRIGRLPFADAVRVITQVARAIGKAHQPHRAPRSQAENVFLVMTDDEESRRFSISGLQSSSGRQSSRATLRVRSLVSCSARGLHESRAGGDTDHVDHRSDLCARCHRVRVRQGQRPFRVAASASCDPDLRLAHPVPSSLAPVPLGFDHWFARAVERDYERRFQSAREMSEALREIANAEGGDGHKPVRATTSTRDHGRRTASLQTDFPSLRSTGAIPSNLPAEGTEFVGRRSELRRVRAMLADSRLVTLVGPGGTGKTRLALRTAAELLDEFPDGVYFVPLAAINEGRLFASAVATSLGVPESQDRPTLDALTEHLAPLRLLVVLDNFEQITGAASDVGRLLDGAAGSECGDLTSSARAPPRAGIRRPPLKYDSDATAKVGRLLDRRRCALRLSRPGSRPQLRPHGGERSGRSTRGDAARGMPSAIELRQLASSFLARLLARRLERGLELLRATAGDCRNGIERSVPLSPGATICSTTPSGLRSAASVRSWAASRRIRP